MQNTIYYQEKLDIIKNEMNHLWTGMYIIGGGTIALLYQPITLPNVILKLLGCVFFVILFNAYFVRRNLTISLLESIKE